MPRGLSYKTLYALDLIRLYKVTPYRAAKLAGIALSTIYRATKREKNKGRVRTD